MIQLISGKEGKQQEIGDSNLYFQVLNRFLGWNNESWGERKSGGLDLLRIIACQEEDQVRGCGHLLVWGSFHLGELSVNKNL